MIQLKNALHVQPIETTLHITFYPILFINLSQKFPTKTSRKKPQPLVSNTAQKLISRYIRDTSHSYILKINSPISQRYHHSPPSPNNFIHRRMQQRSHRSSKKEKEGNILSSE